MASLHECLLGIIVWELQPCKFVMSHMCKAFSKILQVGLRRNIYYFELYFAQHEKYVEGKPFENIDTAFFEYLTLFTLT